MIGWVACIFGHKFHFGLSKKVNPGTEATEIYFSCFAFVVIHSHQKLYDIKYWPILNDITLSNAKYVKDKLFWNKFQNDGEWNYST